MSFAGPRCTPTTWSRCSGSYCPSGYVRISEDVVPATEFRDMAELFEDEEHRRFGQAGFQGVVDKVADIEKSLGIYDLSHFTAS